MAKTVHVGMTYEACPICTEKMAGDVIIQRKLTVNPSKELEELKDKVVGFSSTPCSKCLENLAGRTAAIVMVAELSGKEFHEVYRTGIAAFIPNEDFKTAFKLDEEMQKFRDKHRFIFIDHHAARKIGLIKLEDYEKLNDRIRQAGKEPFVVVPS